MKNKKSGRGGKRKGSGRPSLPKAERRVSITARVMPETKKSIVKISKQESKSIGKIFDETFGATFLNLF